MHYREIVWINGSFDVLHMGHIKLFQRARQMGVPVIVGVDSDDRIAELKGINRPVNYLSDRVEFLRSIKYIDEVKMFATDEELKQTIKSYAPRWMVIGEDYRDKTIIGEEWIKEVIYVPRYGGLSSSAIIGRAHS